jgi:hypothetical protein
MQVQLESPYGTRPDGTRCTPDEVAENVRYAELCIRDSLLRGEAPFASPLLYTRALDDNIPEHREIGIQAGFVIGANAKKTIVYTDRGITLGMIRGIADAEAKGRPIEYRHIYPGTGGW